MSTMTFTSPITIHRVVEMEYVEIPREHRARLTGRGRAVVFALALFAVLLVGFLVAASSSGASHAEQTTTVQVAPGDTLWDIAAAHSAPGKRADMVVQIEQLNHLDGAALQVGQELQVPLG